MSQDSSTGRPQWFRGPFITSEASAKAFADRYGDNFPGGRKQALDLVWIRPKEDKPPSP